MELDEFKQQWDKAAGESRLSNANIMELISNQSSSPLALLERKLKSNFYIFPVAVLVFAGTFISHTTALHNASMWLLFGVLLAEFIFYSFSYSMVKKIQQADGKVKENILNRVIAIHHTLRWQLIVNELLYLVMAVVLEISMHNHWDANFEGWYSVPVIIRMGVYLLALALIFLLKQHSNRRQYGQCLSKLNELVKQMD